MNGNYSWPIPLDFSCSPEWTGKGFDLGDRTLSVLRYGSSDSNWSDALTELHEESAGEHHFIDVASRRHAIEQIQKHVKVSHPTVLEIGCSSGFMLVEMRRALPEAFLIGSDFIIEPLKHLASRVRDFPLMQFDVTKCPLPDSSLDVVVMLNVLEHIEDEDAAIRQVLRILKPGGMAIIEVPSEPNLYDVYDKCLMHCRRYSAKHLCSALQQAGFDIIDRSHLGFFLYPGFWWVKRRNRRHLSADDDTQRRIVSERIRSTGKSRLMHALMRFELWMGNWFSFPFGIRCLVTCRKPIETNSN